MGDMLTQTSTNGRPQYGIDLLPGLADPLIDGPMATTRSSHPRTGKHRGDRRPQGTMELDLEQDHLRARFDGQQLQLRRVMLW